MKLFAYVVRASKEPDSISIKCKVPYEVSSKFIFFGPCKKRLREKFYKCYLKDSNNGKARVPDNIYVLGVNGANPKKVRKIVWLGKVRKVFSFEEAYNNLKVKRKFHEMLNEPCSPLHVKPLYDGRKFIGYQLRSKLHSEDNEWVLDIIQKIDCPDVLIQGKSLRLKDPCKRKDVFLRDCCFLCDNIFFAKGRGIDICGPILKAFKNAQRGKTGISGYYIFGKTKAGVANGLPGNYLGISGKQAKQIICLVSERVKSLPRQKVSSNGRARRRGKSKCM